MKRTLADIRDNLDHVGCDNETAREMADEIERLRAALSESSKACASFVQESESLRAENERLRVALARIELVLQPDDDAEHTETVGRAREIALSALNIHQHSKGSGG